MFTHRVPFHKLARRTRYSPREQRHGDDKRRPWAGLLPVFIVNYDDTRVLARRIMPIASPSHVGPFAAPHISRATRGTLFTQPGKYLASFTLARSAFGRCTHTGRLQRARAGTRRQVSSHYRPPFLATAHPRPVPSPNARSSEGAPCESPRGRTRWHAYRVTTHPTGEIYTPPLYQTQPHALARARGVSRLMMIMILQTCSEQRIEDNFHAPPSKAP